MKNIKNIEVALKLFEEASINQAKATEEGDYKKGNKYYDEIIRIGSFIKSEGAVNALKRLLSHSESGVRIWAAGYLLSVDEEAAIKVLDEVAKSSGIQSLIAETTLKEWKKGNLDF